MLKQSQNLSPVRKRWYNTETVQKPVTSQKKMVQYSNRAKTCQESKKDGAILKKCKNLSAVRKRWYNTQTELKPVTSQKKMYNTQTLPKPVKSQKEMVQFSNRTNVSTVRKRWYNTQTLAKTCHQLEKYGTILKQSQTLSPVRKRW